MLKRYKGEYSRVKLEYTCIQRCGPSSSTNHDETQTVYGSPVDTTTGRKEFAPNLAAAPFLLCSFSQTNLEYKSDEGCLGSSFVWFQGDVLVPILSCCLHNFKCLQLLSKQEFQLRTGWFLWFFELIQWQFQMPDVKSGPVGSLVVVARSIQR